MDAMGKECSVEKLGMIWVNIEQYKIDALFVMHRYQHISDNVRKKGPCTTSLDSALFKV